MAKKAKFNLKSFLIEYKTPLIIGLVIVGFFGWMLYLSNQNKINLNGVDSSKLIAASEQSGNIEEHVYSASNANAKTTLVMYGDYQCGSCSTISPRVKAISEKYGDKLNIVFRNYPISGHANALSAAAAAEAAGLQGKFWAMHDSLYSHQNEWATANAQARTDYYKKYAEEVGVSDINKFVEDMKSSAVSKKINFDKALGAADKITGTPSLFLNGEELKSDVWGNEEEFHKAIEKVIK
ncbi:MAG: DsbA family protein [bacterium]|nr:DsbA family protein [bacterium]